MIVLDVKGHTLQVTSCQILIHGKNVKSKMCLLQISVAQLKSLYRANAYTFQPCDNSAVRSHFAVLYQPMGYKIVFIFLQAPMHCRQTRGTESVQT